ncbi:glycosyltransferase [Prolixibacteraceae bacterium Z1-6]|uniref:Glycosyltransferase n=1 Tax=Draconibacterium aestuarii TaxID=2998507 RepID=A0A9X3J6D0_9BACT|nr:glycosyltransferase [Prolixibacteraceae bacterium Z1-6]
MQETVIIIPCYNESERLDRNVFHSFLEENPTVSLFFVDDGSSDNTHEILYEFERKYENAQCYTLSENKGKAEAIRLSILHLLQNFNIKYIGYFDADLSTSLDYIIAFKQVLDTSPDLKAVTGSRIKKLGSTISRNPLRHIMGRIVATIASSILQLPVYDTQCGAKLFRVSFVQDIFTLPFHTKWLFDIEIFARLKNANGKNIILKSIIEHPLKEWIDEGNSRIKLKDFVRVPIDLLRIYRAY